MKLPNQFQMRLSAYPGWTHKVKKNAHGDYEVTWARGFPNKIGSLPSMTWDEELVKNNVMDCRWEVVDDAPKAEEKQALPDVFCFSCNEKSGTIYKATWDNEQGEYDITWEGRDYEISCFYNVKNLSQQFNSGEWKIIDRKPLTPEQKRFNAEYREQVKALEASIKINEQDIEHKLRLIDNYNERIQTLKSKIVEEV